MTTSVAAAEGTAKSSALMAAGTLVSRILGFVRTALLAVAIGSTATVADIFEKANTIPNIIFLLLAGGIFNVVLIPQLIKASKNRDGGSDYTSRLLTLAVLVLLGFTLIVTLCAGPLITVLTKDWTGPMLALGTIFAYWCLPQIFFYGLYSVVGQVLNANGRFGAFMWAPVVNNIVAIAVIGIYLLMFGSYTSGGGNVQDWTPLQTVVLAGGTTLGIVLQALVLFWPLKKLGLGLRPKFGWRGVGLRQAGKVAGWTLGTMVIGNIANLLYSRLVSGATAARAALPDHGASVAGEQAFNVAQLITLLPHSVFALSIATVLFNRLSRSSAAGHDDEVRGTVSAGLRTIAVPMIFGSTAIVVLAGPLGLLFAGTAATAQLSAAAIGQLLVIIALSVPFKSAYFFMVRVFYAEEDGRTPFILNAILAVGGVLVAYLVSIFVPPTSIAVAVAIIFAVLNVVSAVLTHVFLRRRYGDYGAGAVLDTYIRLGYAALAAGLIGAVLLWILGGYTGGFAWQSIPTAVVTIAAVGLLMAAAYLLMLKSMRVPELDDFLGPLARRIPGR